MEVIKSIYTSLILQLQNVQIAQHMNALLIKQSMNANY